MNSQNPSKKIPTAFLTLALNCCGLISYDDDGVASNQIYMSRHGDKEIHFAIPDKDIPSYPSWRPGTPIPLSIDKAISIGLKELPKYTKNSDHWEFYGVSLTYLHTTGSSPDKWLYQIQFHQKRDSNILGIPITLNGVPIQGTEHPLDKRRWSN